MEGFNIFIGWSVGFSERVVWTKGGGDLGESKVGFDVEGTLVCPLQFKYNVCCITQTFTHTSSNFYTSSHIGNSCRSLPPSLSRHPY